MRSIDINCDMGEGIGNEEQLMPFISSANIACGAHAGSEEEMQRIVELCIKYDVAIGAHPSFPDRKNFGRTEMYLPMKEVFETVKAQIESLQEIVFKAGAVLHHIKPHGALYNMAAKDKTLAISIAEAAKAVNSKLLFYGLSGSVMTDAAAQVGLCAAQEVFADRTYQPDATLTPRTQSNSLIENTHDALKQVLQIIKEKKVTAVNGKAIAINADTVCIHGDGIHAVEFAKSIKEFLNREGIIIQKIKS